MTTIDDQYTFTVCEAPIVAYRGPFRSSSCEKKCDFPLWKNYHEKLLELAFNSQKMVVDYLKILIFKCQSLPLVASELVAGSILIAFRWKTSCEPWSKDGINGFWSSHYKKGVPCNGQINFYLGIDDHPPTWMLHDISSNIWLLLVIFGYRSHSIPLNVPFSDSGITR